MAAMPGKLNHCESLRSVLICYNPLHIEEDSGSLCHALPQPTWPYFISVYIGQCGIKAYSPSMLEIKLSL